MNGTRRDEQLLARLRVVNLGANLELDSSVDHHHDFVRAVDEILPAAARRINPDSAAETPLHPVCFDSFLIQQLINSCWATVRTVKSSRLQPPLVRPVPAAGIKLEFPYV